MMCFWSGILDLVSPGAQLSLFGDHPSKKMKMVKIEKGGCPKEVICIDIVTISCELLGKKMKLGMKGGCCMETLLCVMLNSSTVRYLIFSASERLVTRCFLGNCMVTTCHTVNF